DRGGPGRARSNRRVSGSDRRYLRRLTPGGRAGPRSSRMRRRDGGGLRLGLGLGALLLVSGCGSGEPAVSTQASSVRPVASSDAMAALIEAARKEGEVSWAVASDFTDAATPVHDLVKAKYGLD